MKTDNNNRLTLLLGQQGVECASFFIASMVCLAGLLLVFLLLPESMPYLKSWIMMTSGLAIILSLISLTGYVKSARLTARQLKMQNIFSFVLLLLCGLAWGVLYSRLNEYALPVNADKGFWITVLITLGVAASFRRQLVIGLAWTVMVFFPLAAYLAFGESKPDTDFLIVILVTLGMIFLPAFLFGNKRPEAEAQPDYSKLKKEYDDLTIAFAAQDSAIEAETALRQAVEESLREANRIAEAANRSKTEFMATVGHEIRTPLNGILPILEMLTVTPLNQSQKQLVNTASHSSRHLLRIINDVLDFSKAEVGKLEIESVELNLHELVYAITDLMKQSAETKGLELKVHFAPDVPVFVRGDSLRLKQIITNLLSNALKFTDKGSISLEVTLRADHVREVELMFAVRDSGIGMAEETTSKLFNSFTQADASTTRLHGGTGLGLAICKRLVELMDGDIGVRSLPGRGSTFWFVLPMRKSLKVVPALREHVQDTHILYYLKKRHKTGDIKLIKQECQLQIEICHELDEIAGILSRASRPGKKDFYDLVVIDMSGHEVSEAAEILAFRQQQSALTRVMVINVLPNQEQEYSEAGADAVLVRPFKIEIFRQRIYRLLDIGPDHTLGTLPEEGAILQDMLSTSAVNESNLLDASVTADAEAGYSGRVLLVEDNPVNLAVARRMLQLQGLEVESAKDGRQAVEMMKAEKYDLVFMDCLMPNMDGFEATRTWREYEQELGQKQHQVIIAMTANAMRGDREKCIAAKMDDYLSKPLTLSVLHETLSRWLKKSAVSKGDAKLRSEAEKISFSASTLLDENVLSELQQVMGDDLRSVVISYLQHASQLLTEMKHKAEAGDLVAVTRAAHSFKSSSKNVGAMELGVKAGKLEEQLRSGEQVDVGKAVQHLVISYDEVAKDLQKYV